MPLSEKDLLDVLELFQKSGWEDLQLHSGELRLSISKTGRAPMASTLATAPAASSAVPEARTGATPPPAVVAHRTAPEVDARWIAVKASMLGTFYAAPKPGAPPFVTLGQKVSADDTVGILEVMKLMNDLKAGVAGTVARIDAANGDLAEFDQVLLYIDPN